MKMERPTVTVNLGGRPSVSSSAAPPAAVHVKLDSADYDCVFELAKREGCSPPEILRRALKAWPPFKDEATKVPRGTNLESKGSGLET